MTDQQADVSFRYGFLNGLFFFLAAVLTIASIATGRYWLLPAAPLLALLGMRPVVKVAASRVQIRNFLSNYEFEPGDNRLAIDEPHWRLMYLDDRERWRTATAASQPNEDIMDREPKQHVRLVRLLEEYGYI